MKFSFLVEIENKSFFEASSVQKCQRSKNCHLLSKVSQPFEKADWPKTFELDALTIGLWKYKFLRTCFYDYFIDLWPTGKTSLKVNKNQLFEALLTMSLKDHKVEPFDIHDQHFRIHLQMSYEPPCIHTQGASCSHWHSMLLYCTWNLKMGDQISVI